MSDTKCGVKDDICRKDSLNRGLLMIPNNVKRIRIPVNHKRTGSTGTTGDESYTTDEEDEADTDETDFDIPKKTNFFPNDFGAYSGISTITDKINDASFMHRNNSDISVYSGLEKCSDESVTLNESNSLGENEGDCKCDTVDWSKSSSIVDIDSFTFAELRNSLRDAHQQLKTKKEEIHKLGRIKQEVEAELEDLTASLFQEAHNMVREANERQAVAERALRESEMKVEVLMAEVAALKTLVITSTPSSPNPHLHPQIDRNKDEGVVIFSKKHNRSPSHSHLKYGRGESLPSSMETSWTFSETEKHQQIEIEVDPILYEEFISWKEKPIFDKTSLFLARIYEEDIKPCLSFANSEFSHRVTESVEKGVILIEAVGEKSKSFPRNCALMEASRICSYRMNLGDETDNWYNISQICRNRITAVCDFLNYLKYIERGLVKSSAQDMYNEVMKLRRSMALGRLGFQTTSY
ncbi:hypothetical protein HHI36_011115 [Cryptolaemus montrouzieri]|uniref:GDP/GTP exchange factor Sec2 N-terminal domain-containing protein n=1 Tax=Cryptolaemus montrouzieri TaxID=559131 RepID=A0ABD2MLM4_9CUCU